MVNIYNKTMSSYFFRLGKYRNYRNRRVYLHSRNSTNKQLMSDERRKLSTNVKKVCSTCGEEKLGITTVLLLQQLQNSGSAGFN